MTDYTELVKALRCCANLKTDCTVCPWDKYNYAMCAESLYTTAAAAIEELQAELPKRGEWIEHGEPPMLVIECSVCGQKYFNHALQEKAKYCSMCGAKMEVQDGKD